MNRPRLCPPTGLLLAALVLICPVARAEDMPAQDARELVQEGLQGLKKLIKDDPKDRFLLEAAVGVLDDERAVAIAPTNKLPGEGGKSLPPKGGPVGIMVCLGDLKTPDGLPIVDAGVYLLVTRRTSEQAWSLLCVAAGGLVAATLPAKLDSVTGDITKPAAKLKWQGTKLSLELQFPTFDPDKDDLALKSEVQVGR